MQNISDIVNINDEINNLYILINHYNAICIDKIDILDINIFNIKIELIKKLEESRINQNIFDNKDKINNELIQKEIEIILNKTLTIDNIEFIDQNLNGIKELDDCENEKKDTIQIYDKKEEECKNKLELINNKINIIYNKLNENNYFINIQNISTSEKDRISICMSDDINTKYKNIKDIFNNYISDGFKNYIRLKYNDYFE